MKYIYLKSLKLKFIFIFLLTSFLFKEAIAEKKEFDLSNGLILDEYRLENDKYFLNGDIKKSVLYENWNYWCKGNENWGVKSSEEISFYCAKWFGREIGIKNQNYGFGYTSQILRKYNCLLKSGKLNEKQSKKKFVQEIMDRYRVNEAIAHTLYENKKVIELTKDQNINLRSHIKSCDYYILEFLTPKTTFSFGEKKYMKNGTAKEVYRKLIDDNQYWKSYLSDIYERTKNKSFAINEKNLSYWKKNKCNDLSKDEIPTTNENASYCYKNHGHSLLVADDQLIKCENYEKSKIRVKDDIAKKCIENFGIPLLIDKDKYDLNRISYRVFDIGCYLKEGYINKLQEKNSVLQYMQSFFKIDNNVALKLYESENFKLISERYRRQMPSCIYIISQSKKDKSIYGSWEENLENLRGSVSEEESIAFLRSIPTYQECKEYYDLGIKTSEYRAFECAKRNQLVYFSDGEQSYNFLFPAKNIWQNECLVKEKLISEVEAENDFLKSFFFISNRNGKDFYKNKYLRQVVDHLKERYSSDFYGGCNKYIKYLKLSLSDDNEWPRYILRKRGFDYKAIEEKIIDGSFQE